MMQPMTYPACAPQRCCRLHPDDTCYAAIISPMSYQLELSNPHRCSRQSALERHARQSTIQNRQAKMVSLLRTLRISVVGLRQRDSPLCYPSEEVAKPFRRTQWTCRSIAPWLRHSLWFQTRGKRAANAIPDACCSSCSPPAAPVDNRQLAPSHTGFGSIPTTAKPHSRRWFVFPVSLRSCAPCGWSMSPSWRWRSLA